MTSHDELIKLRELMNLYNKLTPYSISYHSKLDIMSAGYGAVIHLKRGTNVIGTVSGYAQLSRMLDSKIKFHDDKERRLFFQQLVPRLLMPLMEEVNNKIQNSEFCIDKKLFYMSQIELDFIESRIAVIETDEELGKDNA